DQRGNSSGLSKDETRYDCCVTRYLHTRVALALAASLVSLACSKARPCKTILDCPEPDVPLSATALCPPAPDPIDRVSVYVDCVDGYCGHSCSYAHPDRWGIEICPGCPPRHALQDAG